MKLNHIMIMVRDLEKSMEFYCDLLSLKVVREMNPPQGKMVFLAEQKGDTMVELIQFDQVEKVTASGLNFGFSSNEPLSELKEKAQAMGYPTSDIISQPPKPDYFTITDPDGLIIEISKA